MQVKLGNTMYKESLAIVTLVVLVFGTIASCVGAWLTHIVWVIGKIASDGGATLGQVALMIAGVVFPPVGVIHGFMIWLGAGL